MSKDFTKEDVIANKKAAIKELNKLLKLPTPKQGFAP